MEVARGKRSKRLRLSSFFGYPVSMSSSGSEDYDEGKEDSGLLSSATVSAEKEEEEAIANCLILLAQGHRSTQLERHDDGSGFSVYECKTCNRAFPSFQSLGGHRAGHKRPKQTSMGEEKKAFSFIEPLDFNKNSNTPPSSSKGSSINKRKLHECSICGLEFASGQALGGHMRRHRAFSRGGSRSYGSQESGGMEIKQINILRLDLNQPAPPEEDFREPKFQFVQSQQSLVFSAPALVDCHY